MWTPPLFGELFHCQAANVSDAAVTVKIEIVINQGFVVASAIQTIEPGDAAVVTFAPGSVALCYCQLSLTGKAADIRGSLQASSGTDPASTAAVHAW